jgi:leucyl-tRNA synthetase
MKRMQGKNVLFPVGGFDAFGLPAENAAIKHNVHPKDWTYRNIEGMRKQFEKMAPSFDWTKEVITCDPDYYRWTQWIFIQLFKKGLAYKGKVWSNWCPECKTVLANEHVQNGCCWRHTSTPVEQRMVDQWLVRITDYADKLIWGKDSNTNWPEAAVEGQNKWIGRKEGIEISYDIENVGDKVTVWTSRPDTNFGATFIVLAPEHRLVEKILTGEIEVPADVKKKVETYVQKAKNKLERERLAEARVKTGVFSGLYALNMLNSRRMPIWISDFVLDSVGTGAVVGVPGHDVRDFEFAKKFGLPVIRVVKGPNGDSSEITQASQVYEGEGEIINSQFLDGMDSGKAMSVIMDYLEQKGWGRRAVNYHLRDWSVSRRRYWAAPVPMVYCKKCASDKKSYFTESKINDLFHKDQSDWDHYGWFPVKDSDLPVVLPEEVDYTPTGKAPLATAQSWVKTDCPHCGAPATREVETLDTYVDSSWYFFRYISPDYRDGPFDVEKVNAWMPIDTYFGGPEHILGHALYARFISKFFYDLGMIKFEEFARRRVNHGVILGTDGYRMSKSRGNVVNPDEQVDKFGADAVRLFICFLGPHDKGGSWSTEGIEGSYRYLKRVWRLFLDNRNVYISDGKVAREVTAVMNKTIKRVTESIEIFHTNTAIASLMEFANYLQDVADKFGGDGETSSPEWDSALSVFCRLLAPFTPYIAEELWQRNFASKSSGFDSVHLQTWPKFKEEFLILERVKIVVEVDGKLRATLDVASDRKDDKEYVVAEAKKIEGVAKWLGGKNIVKEVFVPGKLLNFVTS